MDGVQRKEQAQASKRPIGETSQTGQPATIAKPSENPPPPPLTKEARKEQQTMMIATAFEKLAMAHGDPAKLKAAEKWAWEAPETGLITARDGRKFMIEVLLEGQRWDDVQEYLVRMANNSYLTKKQVAEYMERVDAGRAGQ